MPFKDAQRQKEYDREKYLRNRAKIIARSRRRNRTHRKEIASYHRNYKEKNRDALNAYHRKWRQTIQSPESKQKEREATRRWCKRNMPKLLERNRRYRAKYQMKFVAHAYVRAVLECELLIRPRRCSKCGKESKPIAHHTDYTKPLEVIWLCHGCHVKAHNGSFHNSP